MTDMNALMTAWLSWCGGVTFTLIFVFALMSRDSLHTRAYRRNSILVSLGFAAVTAILAFWQVGRLFG